MKINLVFLLNKWPKQPDYTCSNPHVQSNICVCPQPGYLSLLHYLGAAVSFVCICFYTVLLTALTTRCQLTGFEKFLYPYRIVSTVIQVIVTICRILL